MKIYKICPHCHEWLSYEEESQTPGFRMMDFLVCPHCNQVIEQSMTVEFMFVRKADIEIENVVAEYKKLAKQGNLLAKAFLEALEDESEN